MSVQVNIPITAKLQKIASQQSVDTLVRTIAQSMLGETRDRIFESGLNAKASPIGTYSPEYIRFRARKYNRGTSSKVILSLTGQMENDWSVIPLGNSSYGLGFKNSFNADKAEWNEDRYGKVFALTPDELKQVNAIVIEWINKQI